MIDWRLHVYIALRTMRHAGPRAYRRLYLRSDHWQRTRKRTMRRAMGYCDDCKLQHAIDVHHVSYANIGREQQYDLLALCRMCHNARHRMVRT